MKQSANLRKNGSALTIYHWKKLDCHLVIGINIYIHMCIIFDDHLSLQAYEISP